MSVYKPSEEKSEHIHLNWSTKKGIALSRPKLLNILSEYGTVKNLCFVPGEDSAYATFENVLQSEAALEGIHGKPREEIFDQRVYCKFAEVVESAAKPDLEAMPSDIESTNVHRIYDIIAPHFSHTRYAPWPKVRIFADSFAPNMLIGDIGCGNGKNLNLVKDGFTIGCDRSIPLVDICAKNKQEVAGGDILNIPYRDNIFDGILCIAVLHHLSTPERRQRSAEELVRVLKSGGRMLVQAWAKEQEAKSRRKFETQDCLVPWCLQSRFLKEGEAEELAEAAGGVIDDKKSVVVFQRYCHVYVQNELSELFNAVKGCEVEEEYYDKGNWCVIVKKM